LVLLANIDLQQHAVRRYKNGKPMFAPARPDYIRRLPELFHESPTVDRFHGIIPGWEIPPFETQQQADGLGLKADYFAAVCHAMRTSPDLAQGGRAKLRLAGNKRDCAAVERLAFRLGRSLCGNVLADGLHERLGDFVPIDASQRVGEDIAVHAGRVNQRVIFDRFAQLVPRQVPGLVATAQVRCVILGFLPAG
jgi:hypothetical protein